MRPAPATVGLRPDVCCRGTVPSVLRALLTCGALAVALPAVAQETEPVTPPSLLEAPEVTLPEGTAPLPGDDAAVVLRLTIDREGRVTDVEIVEPLREDVDQL